MPRWPRAQKSKTPNGFRRASPGVDQDAAGVTAAGVRAKWLVAADGLHSAVRRAVGINAVAGKPRRYGVRWHFSVPAWSEFVEVYWSPWGEAYVTPVEPDLVGVAILSRHRPDLAWFPRLAAAFARRGARAAARLRSAAPGGLPPGRRTGVVSRRRSGIRGCADRRRHQPRRQTSRRRRGSDHRRGAVVV